MLWIVFNLILLLLKAVVIGAGLAIGAGVVVKSMKW